METKGKAKNERILQSQSPCSRNRPSAYRTYVRTYELVAAAARALLLLEAPKLIVDPFGEERCCFVWGGGFLPARER